MTNGVPVPAKGETLRAEWARDVARAVNAIGVAAPSGALVRDGAGGQGFQPLPANRRDRRSKAEGHPWKVYALTKGDDVDHCLEIQIPDDALHVGREAVDIGGVTAVEGSECRYTLDCESEITEAVTLFLAVLYGDDGEGYSARIVAGEEALGEDDEVLSLVAIARVSIDTTGDSERGVVEGQYARSVFSVEPGAASADGVSIARVTADDAEDPDALQIKDFDNDESNGSQGLAQRLKVVKEGESYSIEAEGNAGDIYLLARVGGKLKYIPLSGSKDPDEDEPQPGGADPCDHPGGGEGSDGGVAADDADHGGAAAGGEASGGAGGVASEGDAHPGEACNCE